MWMSGLVIAASVCASALLAGANQVAPKATSPAMPKAEQEVREAVAQFYVALNVLFTGEMKPMNDVWSHADDVTYMGPAGGFWDGVPRCTDEMEIVIVQGNASALITRGASIFTPSCPILF